MKLQGRNVILTGASRGFGKYLAKRLWEEGASLLLVSRTAPLSNDIIGRRPIQCETTADLAQKVEYWREDLTGYIAAESILKHVMDRWDRIDGLINNAAIQGPIGPAWEVDLVEFNRTFAIDLFAPIDLCCSVVPRMLKRKHGKIINLSGGGAAGPRPNYSVYATAKAGLVRFSECLAAELKGAGIDVNCVAPGAMLTDMTKGNPDDAPNQATSDANMKKAADLIVFLLSDESNGITGRLISAVWDDWQSLPLWLERLNKDPDVFTLRREIAWRE